MFHWLRDHRRAKARNRLFPPEWEAFMRAKDAAASALTIARIRQGA